MEILTWISDSSLEFQTDLTSQSTQLHKTLTVTTWPMLGGAKCWVEVQDGPRAVLVLGLTTLRVQLNAPHLYITTGGVIDPRTCVYASYMHATPASGMSIDASPSPESNASLLPPPIPLSSPLLPSPHDPPSLPDLTPPPAIDPNAYSILSRPLTELVTRPKGHIPAAFDRIAGCFAPHCTDYDGGDNFPAPQWLQRRHRDLPAVFRDTFSNFRYWTETQQTSIKDFFAGWDTEEKHPLHPLVGHLISTSTRTPPVKQAAMFNHTMAYYIDHLHHRDKKSLGMIIYNVDIRKSRRAQSFRYGPEGCDFYQCDAYKASEPLGVELLVIAGMKNTWTAPHIDPGGDSTWSMGVEGSKLWVFGRPECSAAFISHFNKPVVWKQWTREDRKFLADHRCLMILQRPGDIVYVPHGWPHMVKHLTDTLAFNSSVLNGWNVAEAIEKMDFDRWTPGEMDMFMEVRKFVQQGYERIGMTGEDVRRLTEVWDQKAEERRAKRRRVDAE